MSTPERTSNQRQQPSFSINFYAENRRELDAFFCRPLSNDIKLERVHTYSPGSERYRPVSHSSFINCDFNNLGFLQDLERQTPKFLCPPPPPPSMLAPHPVFAPVACPPFFDNYTVPPDKCYHYRTDEAIINALLNRDTPSFSMSDLFVSLQRCQLRFVKDYYYDKLLIKCALHIDDSAEPCEAKEAAPHLVGYNAFPHFQRINFH